MAQLVAVFEPIVPMLSGNLVRVSIYGSTVNPFIAAVGAFRFFFFNSFMLRFVSGGHQTDGLFLLPATSDFSYIDWSIFFNDGTIFFNDGTIVYARNIQPCFYFGPGM